MSLALRGIGELLTNDPDWGEGAVGRRRGAALVVEDGRVVWVGDDAHCPPCDEALEVAGAAVLPGFVDSHSHLVFAGERSEEFEARLAGVPYDGGGIARTVAATRAATSEQLRAQARRRRATMLAHGTTTLEAKSGYALEVEGETRLCAIAAELADDATFLGAHVVAPEYVGRRDDYVSLVCGAMLDACAPFVGWADVFCERGAFDVDESRAVLLAARQHGLGVRVHGNQLGPGPGVRLAVELGAASVDHCTHLSDEDVAALAGSTTVATLVPGAEFSTGGPYAPARRLLEAGASIALATDCNPGTSYVTSLPFVIALAVREMGLSVDEAVFAATRGGARALARDDVGHLAPGARADLVVLDAPRAAHLAYRPGEALVARTLRAGVATDGDAATRTVPL